VTGYVPFAGKNSIVEVVLGLQFAQPMVAEIIQKFDVLQSEFGGDFPKFDKMQMVQLSFGVPQPSEPAAPVVAGFNGTRINPDGKIAKSIRGMNNNLSAHFLEYDKWADTKANAIRFFTRCCEILNLPTAQSSITAIALRFMDRFTFDGPVTAASADELLRPGTKYVSNVVFGSGHLWNANTNWNESLMGDQQALHQLVVNGAADKGNAFVMINHNVHFNLPKPLTSIQDIQDRDNAVSIEKIFDAQHVANASLLRNMLNDKMLADIGLGPNQ
jgi:uncharacterized protein (TIGR04255 family)